MTAARTRPCVPMRLSIVIPAFNEEKEIRGCLASVHEALRGAGAGDDETEIIVCDNNSTDGTAEWARAGGARVVFEPVNQISRARNAGAAVARGGWLLFLDADSRLEAGNARRVLELARAGGPVAGLGCTIALTGIPWWALGFQWGWRLLSLARTWAAGSFVFCRADDFQALGGFSLDLFAGEEIDFSERLKKRARETGRRLVILRGRPHLSSGRKLHLYSLRELSRMLVVGLRRPRRTVRDRELLDYFYDGRR